MTEQLYHQNQNDLVEIPPELDFSQLAQPIHGARPGIAPAAPAQEPGADADWGYTQNAQDVAELRRQMEKEAGRAQRHTVGRDSRIQEGVYEGNYGGEAIVVDYKNHPDRIDASLQAITDRVLNKEGYRRDAMQILTAVYDEVRSKMRYDKTEVENILNDFGGRDGTKISLSAYIEQGVGVCRHQALFAGVLLEKLQAQGLIGGRISVDRNMVRRSDDMDDRYDGHAWTRFTDSDGKVYILDPAQGKLAPLDKLIMGRQVDRGSSWDYARPEDHAAFAQKQALQATGQQERVQDNPNDTSNKRKWFKKKHVASNERITQEFRGSQDDINKLQQELFDQSPYALGGDTNANRAGDKNRYSGSIVHGEAIATTTTVHGEQQRLSHIIMAGKDMIAVVATLDKTQQQIRRFELKSLPYGEDPELSHKVDLPIHGRDDSIKQVAIGRAVTDSRGYDAALIMPRNSQMSRLHANLAFNNLGSMTIQDRDSVNGTIVLDASAFRNSSHLRHTLQERLQAHPGEWSDSVIQIGR